MSQSMIPKVSKKQFHAPETVRGIKFSKAQATRAALIIEIAKTQLPGVKVPDFTVCPGPGDRALCLKMVEAELLRPVGIEWDGKARSAATGGYNPQLLGIKTGEVNLEVTEFGRTWA